jgi:uncharacterized membrane protein
MNANTIPPLNRMVIAVLSLAGFFVALYLLASKVGLTGPLICGIGECATVQASKWSTLGPLPVSALGVGGYVMLLAVSLFGLQPAGLSSRPVSVLLVGLSTVALAFSAYLTFLEAFVIRAWCQWCVISAILVTLIFVAALSEVRRLREGSEA